MFFLQWVDLLEENKNEDMKEATEKIAVEENTEKKKAEEKIEEKKIEERIGEKAVIKEEIKKEKIPLIQKIYDIYDKNYKKLLIIPFLLLAFAVILLGFQYATTGEFLHKGVSLKGGLTVTILTAEEADTNAMQNELLAKFPDADIDVRTLTTAGRQTAVTISASDVDEGPLISALEDRFGKFREGDYAVETTGSSLGESFFRETFKAIIIAFLFMGVVVFIYFSENALSKVIAVLLSLTASAMIFFSTATLMYAMAFLLIAVLIYVYSKFSIPSIAVMLAALSDMVTVLAIINLLGIKLSTAGIAGFLMLIGYSVDTDILLSTRVLKIRGGTVLERVIGAMKTGLTMTFATMGAVIAAYIITDSSVLKQIMLILIIGLGCDIIYTWLQNAGILRWYLAKRHKHD